MKSAMESPSGVVGYDLTNITAWYAAENGLPLSVASEHEREFKRFIAVRVANPEVQYAMAGPVDEYWHQFLLATAEYDAFCRAVTGGDFIHHRPVALAGESGSYGRFLEDYAALFGEVPPSEYWPSLKTLAAGVGGDCGTCS